MGECNRNFSALPEADGAGEPACNFRLILFSDADEMNQLLLPKVPEGFFRFSDSPDHRFLSISAKAGKWVATCKKPAFFQNVPLDESCETTLQHEQLLIIEYMERSYFLYVERMSREQMIFHNYSVSSDVEICIGRDPGSDICYDSPYVSRKHAVIYRSGGQWKIQNCGSTYGVYVNHTKIENAYLKTGDVICIMGLRIIVAPNYISITDGDDQIRINRQKLRELATAQSGYPYYYDQDVAELAEPYFNRLPRKRLEMTEKVITVEGPPMSMNQTQMPLMLRMGGSMIRGGAAALAGNFMTLITSVLFPFLSSKYTDKQRQEYEQLRTVKYSEYLALKELEIIEACKYEENILNEKYPEIHNVLQVVKEKVHLWERRPDDSDFLQIRLGTGTQLLSATIEYPERRFELERDALEDRMYQLVETPHYVEDVPITIALTDTHVCSIAGKRSQMIEYVRQLILQVAAFHSYDEVKMVFLLDGEELASLEEIRYIPHTWDDQKNTRFVATDEAEAYRLGEYIKSQISGETEGETNLKKILKKRPYYLLFALNKKLFEGHEIFKDILQADEATGISIITAYDDLPKESQKIISLEANHRAVCTTMSADGGEDTQFGIDQCDKREIDKALRILSNIRLKTAAQAQEIPKMVTFMEMFKAGRLEQLNPLKRWSENNPVKSLAAPVGVGADGSLFMLDLHEKRQGPHGLVAGMTGSGKSEFIITYILSMAVNYHPDEVAFVLIDYKGGGLAGAFENPQTGVRLPHLVGTITNLDGASIQRSLMSIESELIRRQRIFNEIKSTVNEGTMDIYAYQKLYRAGRVSEPLPHLFIISDEFAELKQQQPEFMDKLISAARIGRSLGVHLILATQKPSGVVNDQIRSNTKFRVCLRVQERSDSMDMLKRPEAAELTDTGRFYLQVGYNEYFAIGQSAWCGAAYEPQDTVTVRRDDAIEFLDTTGQVVAKAKPKVRKTDSGMKQIVAVVKYLSELAQRENIKPRQLWLEPMSNVLDLDELQNKYPRRESDSITAMIGMVDDPENQQQNPLIIDLQKCQNMMVIGNSGSGKTMLLRTLLYTLSADYSPEQVNYYIVDFSGGALGVFKIMPHCGTFLTDSNEPEIDRLLKMLKELISERKKLFNQAGVTTFEAFTQIKQIPIVLVVIDNIAGLSTLKKGNTYFATFHEYLKEAAGLGIKFIVSCNNLNEISTRSKQEIGYRIALQMRDKFAYTDALNCRSTMVPPAFSGRGLCVVDGRVLEHQIAIPFSDQNEQQQTHLILAQSRDISELYAQHTPAKRLPMICEEETYEEFCLDIPAGRIPLGYDKQNIRKISVPFSQLYCTSLYFGNPQGVAPVLRNFIYAANRNQMELIVVRRKHNSALADLFQETSQQPAVRLFQNREEDSLQVCQFLMNEIKSRKLHRNAYCQQNGIPLEEAKQPGIMKKAAPYIRQKTTPLMILFEDFEEFCGNLQDGCFKIYNEIFLNGKGYNFYFIAGFYPVETGKLSKEPLTASFCSDALLLFFGGQYQKQALLTMPMEYRKITAPVKQYNEFLMQYGGGVYQLLMPCGALSDEEMDADEQPII